MRRRQEQAQPCRNPSRRIPFSPCPHEPLFSRVCLAVDLRPRALSLRRPLSLFLELVPAAYLGAFPYDLMRDRLEARAPATACESSVPIVYRSTAGGVRHLPSMRCLSTLRSTDHRHRRQTRVGSRCTPRGRPAAMLAVALNESAREYLCGHTPRLLPERKTTQGSPSAC